MLRLNEREQDWWYLLNTHVEYIYVSAHIKPLRLHLTLYELPKHGVIWPIMIMNTVWTEPGKGGAEPVL